MIGKLFKYDFKQVVVKQISIYYILTIFFAILIRILSSLNQTVVVAVIKGICTGCFISLIITAIVTVALRNWGMFTNSCYKDEAYLTHTLPVSKKDIFQAKFLTVIVSLLITLVVCVIGIFIAYYSKANIINTSYYVETVGRMLNIDPWLAITAIFVIFLEEVINIVMCGFFGIILGHLKNSGKTGFSVLFGYITYSISQVLGLIVLAITAIFDKDIKTIFVSQTLENTNVLKKALLIAAILYLIFIGLLDFLCIKTLNKGVNID